MYQALYRKWRPQTFDEVVGQEHITETLKQQVKTGRLSHAYLFIGTRGTGKTTCARILARAVNCQSPEDGNPCGRCAACRGISEGTVLDVVELDAASNNGVDNVRALREEAVFTPASVKKRVYIIDEVHMLSLAAFNALLKILEEPPEHLMFILATTELQKVPATILSRCQRHSFRRIDSERIADYLRMIAQKEQMRLAPEAAELIARLADGGVRDALSLLDQCAAREDIDLDAVYSTMGLAGKRRIAELLQMILDQDTAGVLESFSALWMDGKDPASLLAELSGLLRDVLLLRAAPKSASRLLSGAYDRATLEAFARELSSEELIQGLDSIQQALSGLREARNPRTAAELCLVSLCGGLDADSPVALRARIARLEEMMARGLPARPADAPRYPDEEDEGYPEPEERFCEEISPEEPEEELDPEQFREEQPEDVFLDREPPAPAVEERAPESDVSWARIRSLAAEALPPDLKIALGDENVVRGHVEGELLLLEVIPGFRYERFNKSAVLEIFSRAAREVAGRELRVQLRELRADSARPTRSLEELKGFKEVRFK